MIDVVAHRGFHLTERENTLAAFKAAIDLGVDGVELDVRRTRDGVLVVHHDPTVGSLKIAHSEHSKLPEYVPTLDESLESLDGVLINVEIKNGRGVGEDYDATGEFARDVLRTIESSRSPESCAISCFDLTTCVFVRSLDPDMAVAWLLWDVSFGDALIQAHELGFNAVNPHFTSVDEDVVARARALELDVNVWTVNAKEDLERMVALGVAGIITDDPVLALEILKR
ncbi:MAG TPA: glycerophosphodiester phosphodiesterase [Acidimicrobiales bacterium]|nr:glycerophosphodiester phosphodiesterase [Acidimicrobiales bacterium]